MYALRKMSKNQIAVNSKYFKKTQAKGLLAHAKRQFQNDQNVIDKSRTKFNFGTKDEVLDKRYSDAVLAMSKNVTNSLIDSVLVLPLEALTKLAGNDRLWRVKLNKSIILIMNEMEQETGFKPLGYKLHLDEGHKSEDGKIILNPHAHMYFANHCDQNIILKKTKKITIKDTNGKAMRNPNKPSQYLYECYPDGSVKTEEVDIPLKGRAPLSLHQTRGTHSIWAKQQDIAAKHLQHLGFARGTKKEITKARHLTKSAFIAKELSKAETRLELMAEEENIIKSRIRAFTEILKEKIDLFILAREAFFEKLKIKKQSSKDIALDMNYVIENFREIDDGVKESLLDSTKQHVEDNKVIFETNSSLDQALNLLEKMTLLTKSKSQPDKNTIKFKL